MAVRKLHLGLLLVLGVALGGASLVAAFRLQTPASQAGDPGNSIGTVSFEPSPEDVPEARAGNLVLVTARQGSFGEAYMAVMAAKGRHCPDGRGHSAWDTEPGGEIGADEWDKPSQAAGTRHSQSFRCDGPLPNEIAIPAGTSEAEASALVRRSLAGSEEATVDPVPFNRLTPMYRAFDHALGARVRHMSSGQCGGGPTVVRRIVVGTYPRTQAATNGPLRNETMMLGTDLACLEPGRGEE
jgi:hypothetical protein